MAFSNENSHDLLIKNLYEKASTIPQIEWIDLTTVSDNRSAILVTSPNARRRLQEFTGNFNFQHELNISGGDAEFVAILGQNRPDIDTMYAVGGGRVIDVARLLAHTWDMEITVIPTIISTDSPFVDCTGVRDDGCVRYVKSKKADRVLLDLNLLQQSSKSLHAGGCADVLSIYTALYDWKLAQDRHVAQPDEQYFPIVAQQAEGILQYLLGNETDITIMSRTGLESLVRALAMEVELCNLYGNSRPEEGGEHFFAYAIEPHLPHTTHGELVGLGILVTAYMQGQPWQDMRKFMDSIGMCYRPKGISAQLITETLKTMPGYVNKHNLRYSTWNEYVYDEPNVQQFLSTLSI